jgi:hypothetical protein
MDFDPDATEFTGVLEAELSQLLLKTTARTHNVTAIFDCCHSGRMLCDPDLGAEARYKNLTTFHHEGAYQYTEKLRNEGKLKGKTFAAGNPDAVRIAAAAPWERAVEFPNESGEYEGVLTKALAQAIDEAKGQDVSWKTNARSSSQYP